MESCTPTCFTDAVKSIQEMYENADNNLGLTGAKDLINQLFNEYAFTNQERGVALAQIITAEIQQKANLFLQGAIQLASLKADLDIKKKQATLLEKQILTEIAKEEVERKRITNLTAQTSLAFRQHKNYDDALQKKVLETAGSYANYVVMADPEGAQPSLDNFKIELQNLKNRILGLDSIPTPTASFDETTGHLIETFVRGTITATIENRDAPDNDFIISNGTNSQTKATFEEAIEVLMVYLGIM